MRLSKDEYFLKIASVVAERSTCGRRLVGCVITDEDDYILSTGYNGAPSGGVHCIDFPCPGISYASGMGLDACHSIHAEANAVAHCKNPHLINTVYLTVSPCMPCMKLLLATPTRRIVSIEEYNQDAIQFWEENNRLFNII